MVEFLDNLLEFVRHEVRFLRGALIALEILEETEENRIDSHFVDLEKDVCDEVGSKGHEDDWYEGVVEVQRQASEERVGTAEEEYTKIIINISEINSAF